jgi:two-component system chemotaxis response regulator CheB
MCPEKGGRTMIRVLVVEDSATAREAITAILNRTSEIEVVGEATDGVEGVELAARLKPDVITMDIKMPRMDGYEATRQIMATTPTPIVVVTSVTRQETIHRGLDILLAGALEIVQKPSALTVQDFETISEELIVKVKTVSRIAVQKPGSWRSADSERLARDAFQGPK